MNLEQLRALLAEALERRSTLGGELTAITDTAIAEQRALTDGETAERAAKRGEIEATDERIATLRENIAEREAQEQRETAAAEVRREVGTARVTDAEIYVRGGGNRNSYFRDLANAQVFGDHSAADRLQRHSRALEERALGNTNTVGGSGGEFAPPEWLVADYIKLVRTGRVTADLFNHQDVPPGISSISIPKVLTGTSVAIQSTQNTALAQTDLTTGAVSTGFTTIGGKQVVSQQLLDQSAIDFDAVITQDLAAAYAQQVGVQVITGAGAGANNNAVVNGLVNYAIAAGNQITFTSASPTVQAFYSKAAGAIAAFVNNRKTQPTNWLMHPSRFYWLLAQVDSQGRPLVVPTPVAMNPIATADGTPVAGNTGMTFLSLPVFIDPNLPTNLGAGTNQDEVFLMKRDDLWLFESAPRAEVFREPYAESVGVLFRLYSYVGTILNRYDTSVATINGTGLVAPTF